MIRGFKVFGIALAVAACGAGDDAVLAQNTAFDAAPGARFSEPWAMEFCRTGRCSSARSAAR